MAAGTLISAGLLAVLPGLALFFALRRLLAGPGEGALRAGLAFAAGGGVFGLAHVLALLLGGARGTIVLVELALVGVCLLAGWRVVPNSAAPGPRTAAGPRLAAGAALAASTLALLLGFCRRAGAFGDWDSWAIWTLHARFLHRGRLSGWTDMFTPELGWSHTDYPLALPGAIARIWSLSGAEGAAAPWFVALLPTVCVPVLIYGVLRAARGPVLAAIGALAAASSTPIVAAGAAQYADVPLAACFAAASGLLALAARRDGRSGALLAAAGATASLGAWTKNEGIPFTLALVAVSFVAGGDGSARSRFRHAGAVLLGAAPGLLGFALFRLSLSPEGTTAPGFLDGFVAKWLDPGRHLAILRALIRELSGGHLPALLAAVSAVVLLGPAGRPARRAATQVLGLVALQAAAYHAVFVVTTADLAWHLAHSADRLVVHLVPSLLVGILLLSRDLESPPEPPGSAAPADP